MKELNKPNTEKKLKLFLGVPKYIDNLSAQTHSLMQLQEKENEKVWTEEHTLTFEIR